MYYFNNYNIVELFFFVTLWNTVIIVTICNVHANTCLRGLDGRDYYRLYWSPIEEELYIKIQGKCQTLKAKLYGFFLYEIIVYS